MKELERRAGADIELRFADDDAPVIRGYAAVFDSLSQDLGGFVERIAPGAFDATLGADVRALFNHDPNQVLGRTKSGTLRMSVDARGLAVEITPPASAAPVIEAMRRGDIDGMSFGFRTKKDKWNKMDGKWVRTLLDVDLFDVSVVSFPAYPETEVALRSLNEVAREIEAPAEDTGLQARLARLRLARITGA